MNNSRLRHYHSIKDFFKGIRALIKGVKYIKQAGKDSELFQSFAEKIMLAVTGVNKCDYCSFLHTQTALESGVIEKEVEAILQGSFDRLNKNEAAALLYAQHWADTNGNVSDLTKKNLMEFYGQKKADQIEGYIRIVYLGNMCSNTVVFFEDKNIPKSDKTGLFPVYLLCKPIAGSIRNCGKKLEKKRKIEIAP